METKGLVRLLLLFVTCASARKLPSYIEKCNLRDSLPKFQDCFRKAVEVLRPRFDKGIPELQIPSLDPLVLERASLDSGPNFHATFTNIEIFHAQEFVLKKLDIDLKNNHIEVGVFFPRLRIKSNFEINGRLLILQLNGKGPADGNFTNVAATFMADGFRNVKNGKEYLKMSDYKIILDLGKPVLKFDNVFRENQELNERTNKLVNENIVEIIEELKPVVDDTVGAVVKDIISRIFNRFSIDELFLS